MKRDDLEAQARAIIAKSFNVDLSAVTGEASFTDDLGGDSVDVVEMLMALQDQFGVEIPDAEAERFRRLDDVVAFLAGKLSV